MDLKRRSFVKKVLNILGLLFGIIFFYRFLMPTKNNNLDIVTIKLSDIPGEGALILPEKKLAVLRTKGRFEVYSTVCTHLGCNVSFSKEGFSCPCHGSKFDIWGNVLKGPAVKPLNKVKFKITSDELNIFV